MDLYYENVIIGGGPSGTSCGITLQKKGVPNCIIDKAVFPREKTCGGLVTAKTYALISSLFDHDQAEIDALFCNRVSEAALYFHTRELVKTSFSEPVRFVERRNFDYALTRHYKKLGGTLFEGERSIVFNERKREIAISGNRVIHYKNLVYADGAFSRSHKRFDIAPEDMAFCVETFLPGDAFDLHEVRLHFGYAENGYIWVFPYGHSICVGAGGSNLKKVDFKKVLINFLQENGIETEGLTFRGAFVPNGFPVSQERLPQNTLLIGDAAGFADPISGEGLYFGPLSGICAAKSLQAARPKMTYLKRMQPVYEIIRDGQRLQKFFYDPRIQKRFIQGATGNTTFVKHYFDQQVSYYNYGYSRMLRLYMDYKKIKRRIKRSGKRTSK